MISKEEEKNYKKPKRRITLTSITLENSNASITSKAKQWSLDAINFVLKSLRPRNGRGFV